MSNLAEKINDLPRSMQSEVEDYVDFLIKKRGLKVVTPPLRLSWAGRLSELRDKYSSCELQKKSLEWWQS
ncbi:MAG: DUF2281 domain-containing protein [Trichlorobacter sp.]|nr:DUF2281 domain-containing protein [Trichlorobacter sp.]